MSNYGEPDWTTPTSPGAASAPTVPANDFTSITQPTTSGGGGGLSPSEAKADRAGLAQKCLSIFNILTCALMIFLGVEGILSINFVEGIIDFSFLFVTLYMFIFASLLFSYEITWWVSVDSVNKMMRKNFGFMYGIRGKGFYMIFVAFLCLGLEAKKDLALLMYSTGILWLVTGILHIFLWYWRPHLVSSYQGSSAGYSNNASNNV